jgi:hypothetical protein
MAILLIKDRDATHADPVKDARGCYKRGDVVQVFEDDRVLQLPPAPPFVIVKITGVTKAQAEAFYAPHTEDVPCATCAGTTFDPTPVEGQTVPCRRCLGRGLIAETRTRRLHHLDWASLPNVVKNALVTDRYYETTWAAVRAYVKNKQTGAGA